MGQPAEQPIVIFGDWIINDSVSYSNKTIIVDNGNIIIEIGGSLTLNNTLLELRYTTNAGYKIEIQNGGSLFLYNSSVTASYPELNFYYYFRNYGYLNMQNSSVSMAYSIHFYDSSDDSSVINNSTIKNNANYGIYANLASPTVNQNTISDSGSYGVYAYYASPNIINNTISDSGSYGIYANVYASPNIINNTISGSNSHGIRAYHHSSPRIENNTIKNNNEGIYISYSSSPTIINNIIDKNGQYGVHVAQYSSSSYPKIIGCTISDQTYGIRSDYQTITVENSTISSTSYDYYLYYSAYIKSTNTSFSKSKVYFSGTAGVLDVYWHLDVNVVDANANPVSKANVSVRDYFDTVIYNGTTDLEGWTREIVSEEYNQTAAGETYYTPHNVSAEYNDTANSTIVTIAESKEATVMLSINQPLTALILSPDNNSLFIQGDTIDFTGIGFDPIDGILSNSSLIWTSSIDGEIGIGSYLSLTNLSVGNHTVTFTATNSLNENVTDTVEITVIGRADLIVVDVEWSHMSPNLDDIVTFNATVKNIGMGYAIQPFYVRFYINHTYLGQTIVSHLSANESIIVTQTWTAAPDAEIITVVADYYDDIHEINESNNRRTELLPPIRLPDIVVSAITWTPTTFNESQIVNFSALVENTGAGNTTRYFEVKFYIDNTSIGSVGVNGIMAGNITSVSRTWTATPGDHTIKVVADDLNQVPEYNETNNDKIESLAMIEYADLTVSSVTWIPATFCDGDNVNFTAIVENIGAGNITKYLDVMFYIDNSSIGSVGVNGLMSGDNVSVWKTWTAAPGNHTLKVVADDPNRVIESNETNNERSESLPGIEQADLIVENITWPPSNLSEGQVVTFTASVGNIGPGNTTREFYTRFLIDNASIGEKSVSGLDSGSSATRNQTWTATAGEHMIKAVVDAYNHVVESNETNNWLSKNISHVQVGYLLFISSSSESYAECDNATFSAKASRQSSPTDYLGDNDVNLSLTILDESDIIVFTSPMSYANKVFSGNVNLTGYSKGNYTARVTLKDNNNVTVEKSIPFMVVENFSVSISTNKLIYDRDEIVHIAGNAQYTDGSPVISAPVVLKIKLKGYTRTYSLVTGSDGNFSYYYNPNYMEAGNFTAEANVVSDKLWRSAQTSYTMYGLYLNPSGIIDYWMSKNSSENLTFILRNYGESYLNNVTVNVVDEDMGDGVDAILLQPLTPTLMPDAEQLFTLKLTAGNVAVLQANFSVSVTSAEGSSEEANLFVHLVEAVPIAIVNPTAIEAGMNPDDLLVRTVNITNNGYESMNNINISIPTRDWMSVTSTDLGSISPGMGKFFDIIIHPTNETAQGVYQETITISSSNHQPVSIYLSISVTSSQQGDLMFRVVNDVGENITGASIVIQNQDVLTQVFQGTTNETGYYLFDDISTSRYNFIVQASGHTSTSNSITVAPEVQTLVEPVLPKDILGVQLTVTPIQIGDEYDIELNLTFETEVPPPILIPNPLYISYGVNFTYPEYETDGSITISNPGLISVFNVTVDSSFLADVNITFPTGKTFDIGELKAKSSVTIPYHLTVTSVSCESTRHRGDIRINGDYIYFEEHSDVTHNVYLSSEIPVFIYMYNCPVDPGNPIDDILEHFTFHYVLPGGGYSPGIPLPPPIPPVVDTVHERVKFSISQEATLERDAFAACLELTNKLTDKNIEGVKVVLNIKDENSSDASDMFFVNQTFLNNINSINGSGVINPSAVATADWLLVPKPGTGGTDSAGIDYTVQAFINYTVDGVPFSVNSTEAKINVMPQPLLNLTYMIPDEVKAGTPFTITLNVTNVGYGIARNLKFDSAQPVIYDNEAGLLVSFELIGSGIVGGAASDSILINFGDIAPGENKTAYWIMTASLDGEFTEFKGSFSHSSALGGAETSLIKNITYIIISSYPTPICKIELREQGTTSTIDEVNVGEIFDIYVGDSTDDIGITEVRFSSDVSQDGNPTGEWTDWYDWGTSLDDWDAVNKIKAWAFVDTAGDKEVWAEVKDGDGQTDNGTCTVHVAGPIEPFTFVQVTDVHIGWAVEITSAKLKFTKESVERFTEIIQTINDMSPKPKFVLITGDQVEFNEPDFFYKFLNVLTNLDSSIPYYHIPGNHDRRKIIPLGDLGDDNLENYHECIIVNGPIERYLIRPDNYTFEEGGYLFVGLDSGKDFNVFSSLPWDGLPEGEGLTYDQMSELIKLPKDMPKIIFMHHPAINSENDYDGLGSEEPVLPNGPGGNDACIAFYRDLFVTGYCNNYNVQLVLTGHTHKDKIFNAKGNPVGVKSKDRPLFIQTRSATKDVYGFRCINIDATGAHPEHSEHIIKFRRKTVWADGLGNIVLQAYDSEGRHTGMDENGNIVREIPETYYIGNYGDLNLQGIIFYNPDEDYKLTVTLKDGSIVPKAKKLRQPEDQSFNLTITNQTADSLTTISYTNIPFTETTTATVNLNRTAVNYTMAIDYNGDTITDETRDPDSIGTDYEPTAVINSPVNNSIYHYGDQILFNGMGIDVEDGILTNTSLVWTSDSDGFIGIDCECSTTNLTTGTHIIGLTVNDSSGQTDTDTVTITVIAPDLAVTNITLSNQYPIEGEAVTINATIGNLGTDDAVDVTVQFFDGTPTNGTQIGADHTIAALNIGENKTVTVDWNTTSEAGDNCIWVVADPADAITEPDEENNRANCNIFVSAPDVLHIVQARTDKAVYIENEAVSISCVVQNASGNISANVSAEIEKPDSGLDNVTLAEGLTGNYSGTFTNTSLSGRYNVTIYANRTGFVGDTELLSFEVPDTTPPASVTNLTSTTGSTWINWTWDNPIDSDFDFTLIYLDGSWKTATAGNYYLADGLNASTEYEIATQTVDADGNINTTWVNQTAETKVENLPPVANFTYSPESPIVNQMIFFNASNSTDSDGNITEYKWDFGDGNSTNTTEAIINHSYLLAGDYTVNLTVTDDDEAANSTSKIITVTRLCGDVAPYPDCNGIVDMGDVILLLNNVSYPEDPSYILSNNWAGDCRCTGVRDMGDVILLLNNVSYPEDPRYVLDCC